MNAVAVALTLAALWFVEKMLGTPMVIRPIVVAPLIGLELGDLKTGLLIGAELELVFMSIRNPLVFDNKRRYLFATKVTHSACAVISNYYHE